MKSEVDVIVIGGGINGTAIARDASLRGLSVLLLEREDFACGASSKSSKLAHGGLRYLEHYEFGLVRESLVERGLLLKLTPDLVCPLPFVFPVYKGDKRPLWQVKLGLWLYDWLWRDKNLPRHSSLKPQAIMEMFPGIRSEGLRGGGKYYDAQMEDHRLVIENMLAAERAGAQIWNYSPVEGLLHENGHVVGVRYHHEGEQHEARARVVVNATGSWSNGVVQMDPIPGQVRVSPTKGVHITLTQIHPDTALILSAPQDDRIFFIIPWEGMSLVGTTDTDFKGDPSDVKVEEEDIDYLLEAYNHYFPGLLRHRGQVISSFAGLRPLVAPSERLLPSSISREHVCEASPSGVLTIVGGKYTTYRAMAEEVVDVVVERFTDRLNLKPCCTHQEPLDVSNDRDEAIDNIIQVDPELARPLCTQHPHIAAELVYAVEREKAAELEDWFYRRTFIGYGPCRGLECLQVTADLFQRLHKWSDMEKTERMERYARNLSR